MANFVKSTTDQALIREMNLSLVLRNIHNEAPLSRVNLAQMTGLNKSIIKRAAAGGVEKAIESMVEAGRAIRQGMVGLVNIFNPEKIVVGGSLRTIENYFRPSVFDAVKISLE